MEKAGQTGFGPVVDIHEFLKTAGFFVIAYGCARAWSTLTFTRDAAVAGLAFNPHHTFDAAYILLALAVLLLFRKLIPLNENALLRRSMLACMLGGSLLFMAGAQFQQPWLVVVASLIAGAGYAAFLLLSAEVLVTYSLLVIFLAFSLATLIGVGITFLCSGMGQLQLAVTLVLLPLSAYLCLRNAFLGIPEASRPRGFAPKFRYPWKLFALYGAFAFVYGLRASQLVGGAGTHSSASTAILMTVLFLSAFFFARRFNVSALYRSPALLVVCGLLLIPAESLFGTAASSYLIAIGYSFMSFLIIFLLMDISKRTGAAIVALYAVRLIEQVFVLAGRGTTELVTASGLAVGSQNLVLAVLASVLIMGATILLFSERELAAKWGVDVLETGSIAGQDQAEVQRRHTCSTLAQQHQLSPREEEILQLLAAGRTGRQIQNELFIAEGTFKTHCHRIYEKIGVANRKELLDLIGAQE